MQPTAYPVDREKLLAVWQHFVEQGQLLDGDLDPAIVRSWQRCAPRLNPYAPPQQVILSPQALEQLLINHFDLIAIARPLMEDIHQFVEGSDFVVVLVDNTACVLELLGDPSMVEQAQEIRLIPGAYWDEGRMGTNAFALALLEGIAVQVVGAEHFFAAFHPYADSAAPIHNIDGRPIGALGMLGLARDSHSHTLGLVMAAARAIENQLQADLYLWETNCRLAELNCMIEAISDGILSWNNEGVITHLNAQAGEILGLKPSAVVGHSLEEVMALPPMIVEAIQRGEMLRDIEGRFQVNGREVDCLVSLKPIFEGRRGPVGYIITLQRIERVRRLVHRLVGAQAAMTLEDVIGESPAIRCVRRQALVAAKGTAPVLIRGESGTGKNPLVRAIHNESPRANGPFITINCPAIPNELVLSEFLGYEGGAFSGALAEGRPSKFELAHGGTLLLEQVECLPLNMQAALVPIIETGEVMRLGGTRVIPVDVRIIATSAANLEQLVAEGRFRADLFYRLSAFVITLPPLRERVEDIPLIVTHLLDQFARQSRREVTITPRAMEALMAYPWPGNVRELQNVLERALVMAEADVIDLKHLPVAIREHRTLIPCSPRMEPILTLEEAEREAICRAGYACQGRVKEMSAMLGISRTTLWRKMKAYKISLQDFKNLPASPGVFQNETKVP